MNKVYDGGGHGGHGELHQQPDLVDRHTVSAYYTSGCQRSDNDIFCLRSLSGEWARSAAWRITALIAFSRNRMS